MSLRYEPLKRRYGADVHTRPHPFDTPAAAAEVVKSDAVGFEIGVGSVFAVAKPAAQPLEFALRGGREFSSGRNKRESCADDFAEQVPNLPDVTLVPPPPPNIARVFVPDVNFEPQPLFCRLQGLGVTAVPTPTP